MNQPTIDLIPLKQAVRNDNPVTLDILVRIIPPAAPLNAARPALNLGLVIDRSGSMASHKKIDYAREAAIFAVQQLLPTDRVSVTVFDDEVQSPIPSTLAEEKGRIVDVLRGIQPRNSTALHSGWQEGGRQVAGHHIAGGLNRVLLLSDGIANVGETNPDVIGTDVHRLALEGVTTTTMGLGDDYNEDLLEAMARSGDGNYYYIESPKQLPDLFQTELQGLMATFGSGVTLNVEPGPGVTVADILNDLEKTPEGKIRLPNLVAGMPILVVVRLQIEAMARQPLCRFSLSWNAPKEATLQKASSELTLPAVTEAVWNTLAASVEVEVRACLLLMARYKKFATECLDRHDMEGVKRWLNEAKKLLATAPNTPEVQQEAEAFGLIEADLDEGAFTKFQKRAKYQSHQRRSSKPYP